jgi:hypothetical protein
MTTLTAKRADAAGASDMFAKSLGKVQAPSASQMFKPPTMPKPPLAPKPPSLPPGGLPKPPNKLGQIKQHTATPASPGVLSSTPQASKPPSGPYDTADATFASDPVNATANALTTTTGTLESASLIPGGTSAIRGAGNLAGKIPYAGKLLGPLGRGAAAFAGLSMLPNYGAYVAMQAPVDAYNVATGKTPLHDFDKGVQQSDYVSGAATGLMTPGTAAISLGNTAAENFSAPVPTITGNKGLDQGLHYTRQGLGAVAPPVLIANTLTRDNPQSMKDFGTNLHGMVSSLTQDPSQTMSRTMRGPVESNAELRQARPNPNTPKPSAPTAGIPWDKIPAHTPGIAFDPNKGFVAPKPVVDTAQSLKNIDASKARVANMEKMRAEIASSRSAPSPRGRFSNLVKLPPK